MGKVLGIVYYTNTTHLIRKAGYTKATTQTAAKPIFFALSKFIFVIRIQNLLVGNAQIPHRHSRMRVVQHLADFFRSSALPDCISALVLNVNAESTLSARTPWSISWFTM